VFDNAYDRHTKTALQSRGMLLAMDERRRTVRLSQAFHHHRPLLSASMGNLQILPDSHVLIGWGSQPYVDEFTSDGATVVDARLPPGQQSYRSYRQPWTGSPHHAPALRAERHHASSNSTLYASWNGATELASWQVRVGPHPSHMSPIGTIRRDGFETTIALNGDSGYVAVTALDAAGRTLRTSRTIRL
jgi:hypothetical protein